MKLFSNSSNTIKTIYPGIENSPKILGMANLKIRKKADIAMVHQGGLLCCHCSMYRQRLIEILTAVNCTKPPILA